MGRRVLTRTPSRVKDFLVNIYFFKEHMKDNKLRGFLKDKRKVFKSICVFPAKKELKDFFFKKRMDFL